MFDKKENNYFINWLGIVLLMIVYTILSLTLMMYIKYSIIMEADMEILSLRVNVLERDVEKLTAVEENIEEVIKPMHIVEEILVFEPEEPKVADEIISEAPLRYEFTDDDIYIMARLLCGNKNIDGDGEYDFDYGNDDRYDQISIVLGVVMNRVMDDRFPNTIKDVILQKTGNTYQFSPVKYWSSSNIEISDIARLRVLEWCEAYNKNQVPSIPETHVYFSSNGKGCNISRPNYK